MPANDPVGIALASIGAGATTGAAVITVGLIILRLLPAPADVPAAGVATTAAATVIQVSVLTGILAAAAAGWMLARPLPDYFRRGVTAALGVFGALLLSAVAVPADRFAQVTGLAVLLLVLVAADVCAVHKARRAGAGRTA